MEYGNIAFFPKLIEMTRQLNPSRRILLGPGPSDIHPRVLQAMATPVIGHLDPEFVQMMDEVKDMLRQTMITTNPMTYCISGPGSAGMESSLINVLEPGDTAVICINGVFGGRMADICERIGAKVVKVESPWGEIIEPDAVKNALENCDPKLVAIVHAETSTGVKQPLKEISRLTHEKGALFVVDGVTSFCGTELRLEEWGIDVFYTGSQKCLSAPPGLSPTSFSERALEVALNRKSKVSSWFLDVNLLAAYWSGQKRAYHHTAPISAIYALREALRLVLEEGLEARWQRHERNALILRTKLEELGFSIAVDPAHRLPMLTVVRLPQGLEDGPTRSRLLHEYNIEVGGGLGKFAGEVWRIGLMGEGSNPNYINALTGALSEIIKDI